MNFRQDSTFLLRNAISGSSAFSFIGNWHKVNDSAVILFNPYVKSGEDTTVRAPRAGERLDALLAASDHRYIFPTITSDTIVFANDMKSFTLKGYKFTRSNRVKE